MQKEMIPCYGCLKLPVCKNKEKIECSDLFFIVLDNADFDRGNKIINQEIKDFIKKLLLEVNHILPDHDWKERLNDNSMRGLHNISSL